ncbi:MAG TPA: 2-oxoacid:acceptor oxidoreductase subunit alpha [Myxococcales bacterium]|nr:2-oxoacid:acceptor oxidoreductase subunit alpha [Myxococcales bacterium]HIN86750.1 2-oxoacid:acceptor oxidoreductase subunit alpha [Myxococcales bacterium]
MSATPQAPKKPRTELERVTIRFVGDSGDGMQLTGGQFTAASAVAGNDLATLPDFPAEIRAPAGTLAGVSGFQIQFAAHNVYTPGDAPDVLVCMNPAALKANMEDLVTGGALIVNSDGFSPNNLRKAGWDSNPIEDGSLNNWNLYKVPMETMTMETVKDLGLPTRTAKMCKNFLALGLMYWLYDRPMEETLNFIETKFGPKNPALAEANSRLIKAGWAFGETCEMFTANYMVPAAKVKAGTYRNIRGNEALAMGLVAASQMSGLELFVGAYPITPASDVFHSLAGYKHFGVKTFQAEDEISGVCAAIGASFAGSLGVTLSSGPGIALKGEAIGLAHIVELPLVICNIQRGGPSTGLPTKTEQSDLMQAMYGRNGEAPLPIIAARSASDAFAAAYEACQIAVKYMTPVMLLSDGYIATGAEPWCIPKVEDLADFDVEYQTAGESFLGYSRDETTLARPWAIPGTKGLEHRVGGLEKADGSGNVSYNPDNHDYMCRIRAEKIQRIQQDIPPSEILGDDSGDLLMVGWGGTYGALVAATHAARAKGLKVSLLHLRHLNPLPPDLKDIMDRFGKILVPEINLGQLVKILRAEYLIDAQGYNEVKGLPFKVANLVKAIEDTLEAK